MSRLIAVLLVGIALALPIRAVAQNSPVVVELFTSQGCYSCPPADEFLEELAARDDVVPLALHVDYWNRLGWVDTFSDEIYTDRQYRYANTFRNRSVWTPQFVVQGRSFSRGNFREMVNEFVDRYQRSEPKVVLQASENGDTITINAVPIERALPEMALIIAHYTPEETVRIERGENAGKTITYHNVVTDWRVVGKWRGQNPATLEVPLSAGRPLAVMIQTLPQGTILASQVLR